MSSSADAGYYAEQARKTMETKCEKSADGKHKWYTHSPGSPSTWKECVNCGATAYFK